MSRPTTRRMSRVDTAWLRMDSAANLMVIVGVWVLEPPLGYDALVERVQSTLLQYERFRARVVDDALGYNWVEDLAFDVHAHIVREPLRRRRGQTWDEALQALVGRLATEPLDRARPLWRMHLVEDMDGRSALVCRFHHCIADGIALTAVTLAMTDGGTPPPVPPAAATDETASPVEDWLSESVLKPLTGLTIKAIGLSGEGLAKSMDALANPAQPLQGSLDLARAGAQVLRDAAGLALMADDSTTRLKGKALPGKVVAWGTPLPLDEVKAIGRALGCSVNDVLLAAVAGAIGDYLRDKGDDTAGQEIRAMVPVNLRPLEQAHELGNRFGLAPLLLPIGVTNPVERVYAVRRRMDELKGGYQPVLAYALLALAGLLVKPAQDALLNLFSRKATAVMTNVPGPTKPLTFCGSTIRQILVWVPQSGDIGVGVSILSYAGGVQFGLITDSHLCPDPQAIIARFEPEFDKLLWLTMMLPWGQA